MKYSIILDPIGSALDEAKKYMGVVEVPKLSNRGLSIDYWLNECGIPLGNPWCAAFVTAILRQALGRGNPVYLTGSVQRIVDWAKTLQPIGVWQDKPERGDLFVIYFPSLKRFGHVGFVEAVTEAGFTTIEGNSNADGSRDGYGVGSNKRKVTDSIKFVRWVNALPDKS